MRLSPQRMEIFFFDDLIVAAGDVHFLVSALSECLNMWVISYVCLFECIIIIIIFIVGAG